MFGIGLREFMLILAVALTVFGRKKVFQIGKLLGKAIGEFKNVSEGIKGNFE